MMDIKTLVTQQRQGISSVVKIYHCRDQNFSNTTETGYIICCEVGQRQDVPHLMI